MYHLSYVDIHNRIIKLGNLSLYVRTSNHVHELLEYLYSEMCDMCDRHILSERGQIFKIEYGEYGIVVSSIYHSDARHIKSFSTYSAKEFEALKKCLVALSKIFQIYIKSNSFEQSFVVAFIRQKKVGVAG